MYLDDSILGHVGLAQNEDFIAREQLRVFGRVGEHVGHFVVFRPALGARKNASKDTCLLTHTQRKNTPHSKRE